MPPLGLTRYGETEAATDSDQATLPPISKLHDEIADLDTMIAAIVDELAPNLVTRNSIGPTGAAQLLLTAGGNPDRMRSEASFAALCGVSPVPASSGMTIRHRLNRGGDRAANSALHIIAIGRLRTDQKTKDPQQSAGDVCKHWRDFPCRNELIPETRPTPRIE